MAEAMAIDLSRPDSALHDVPLKGSRAYLHSTDLWMALERRLAAAPAAGTRQMSITFRRTASRSAAIVALQDADPGRKFADVRIADGASTADYALVETDAEVRDRVACPEERLKPLIRLDGETASITVPPFATALESLVAATKALHLARVDPQARWMVGRLELPAPFPAGRGDTITVRLLHRLPRQATVSGVEVGGRPAGTLMFNVLR